MTGELGIYKQLNLTHDKQAKLNYHYTRSVRSHAHEDRTRVELDKQLERLLPDLGGNNRTKISLSLEDLLVVLQEWPAFKFCWIKIQINSCVLQTDLQ